MTGQQVHAGSSGGSMAPLPERLRHLRRRRQARLARQALVLGTWMASALALAAGLAGLAAALR